MCRFRPIRAADTSNQSAKSSLAAADNVISRHNIDRATFASSSSVQAPGVVGPSRRSSRTFLLPSPSSAFSVPPSRQTDTVPPTACRNADVDVPSSQTAQSHGTPDMECRYRRRGTVREMAQSYDRAAQNEVSTRRLSYTFRPTLPTTTTTTTTTSTSSGISSSFAYRPSNAAETSRDHYTTTSVFSVSGESDKANEMKGHHETKLRRLYSNTVASLHKSIDNFTSKLHVPFTATGSNRRTAQDPASSELELLRRSASIQHIQSARDHDSSSFRNNNNNYNSSSSSNNNTATFPLSSRHHSVSIQSLSRLSSRGPRPETETRRNDVIAGGAEPAGYNQKQQRSHSSWSIASQAPTESWDITSNNPTETKKGHEPDTKTAEIKVVLEKAAETAVTTSGLQRCLTVRQSPSNLSTSPSDTGVTTTSVLTQSPSLLLSSRTTTTTTTTRTTTTSTGVTTTSLSMQSPHLLMSSRTITTTGTTTTNTGVTTTTSQLSMAFVSPRPMRKIFTTHHVLEPLQSQAARPTSAAALERLNDAQQLLMKTADLPSTSDGLGIQSSASPAKSLIELVRESHLNVFSPFLNPAHSPPANARATSRDRRDAAEWSSGVRSRMSGVWNDYDAANDRNKSSESAAGSANDGRKVFLQSASPAAASPFPGTPGTGAGTEISRAAWSSGTRTQQSRLSGVWADRSSANDRNESMILQPVSPVSRQVTGRTGAAEATSQRTEAVPGISNNMITSSSPVRRSSPSAAQPQRAQIAVIAPRVNNGLETSRQITPATTAATTVTSNHHHHHHHHRDQTLLKDDTFRTHSSRKEDSLQNLALSQPSKHQLQALTTSSSSSAAAAAAVSAGYSAGLPLTSPVLASSTHHHLGLQQSRGTSLVGRSSSSQGNR